MELFTIIPQIHFEALGSTRELYKLYPDNSNILHPLPDKLEWQADDLNHGKATIFLETVPEAFGDEMISSNQEIVTVGPISLVVQQSATILEGEYAPLAVKLSKSPPKNDTIYVNAIRSDGDEDIYVINLEPITFNDTDWDDYKLFVVKANEDEDSESGSADITVSAENMEDVIVTVYERDNDIINIVTNEDVFSIVEGISKYTGLKIKLDNEPTSSITVKVTHDYGDEDIIVKSGGVIDFDDSNWNRYKTVTLAARQDDDLESGVAMFKISTNDTEINDKFVTVKEIEIMNNALAIEAATFRTYFSTTGVNYLYDEIVGTIPLTKQCDSFGLGTVKGSALLDYNGSGTTVPYGDVVCMVDIVGVAHITVEDNNFTCEENPSINLSLTVKTDYLYINICPSLPPSSTPNIDEYDGRIVLNLDNEYQFELKDEWEEENEFGSDYLFIEMLGPESN